MKVFKACFKITRRHIISLLIYFSAFTLLAVLLSFSMKPADNTDFEKTRPTYSLISRDGETPAVLGLRAFLDTVGDRVELEDDKKALQDATFFHASDYILILPQGFSESLLTDSPLEAETVTTPDSAGGYYMDIQVNQYLRLFQAFHLAAPESNLTELAAKTSDAVSAEAQVETVSFGKQQPVPEQAAMYFQVLPYILLVLIISCVSTIMMPFQRPDLRMRNMCSPLPALKINLQLILFGAAVSFLAWLVLILTGFGLYGSYLAGIDFRSLLLLFGNSLALTAVCLSIAILTGSFIKTSSSQNAVANIFSLACSFLGGVFVPLEMLGEGVLRVARLVPTYWYSMALKKICALTSYSPETLEPIWKDMLVQVGFAAAFFCISLVIYKVKNTSEKSFSRVQTELNA